MNNFLQPATISDAYGESFGSSNQSSFSTSMQMFGINNARISQPPFSYKDVLNDIKSDMMPLTKSEAEINDMNESEKLKSDATHIIKKLIVTRAKSKEINEKLKAAKDNLNKFKEVGNNFVKYHNDFFSMLVVNNPKIKDDRRSVNKMLKEADAIEQKHNKNIKMLEEEQKEVINLLTTLTTFINTSLKQEMNEQELAAIQSGQKCGICIENDINLAFIPCGHTICSGCSTDVSRCHICRARIENKIKLYFS